MLFFKGKALPPNSNKEQKGNKPMANEKDKLHKAEMLVRGTVEGMHATREVLEAFDQLYHQLGEAQRCLALCKVPADKCIWDVIAMLQDIQSDLSRHKATYEAERLCRLAALCEAVACLGKPVSLARPRRCLKRD